MTADRCDHPCFVCAVDRTAPRPPPADPVVVAPAPDQALTVADVAEVLHCSPNHVRKLIRDSQLAAFTLAGGLKVRRSTVERFMADLEQQAAS